MALRFRLPVLVASLVALAALAAGCGSGQRNAALPVLSDLTLVADTTDKVESARFEMTMTMEMPGFGGELGFDASGAFDAPAKKAEITIDMSAFAKLLGGFAQAFGGSAQDLPDVDDWKLDVRLDGTVIYMRFALMEAELPKGKSWVKVDLATMPDAGAAFEQMRAFSDSSDPRQLLPYLRSLSDGVEVVGTEEVRGAATTHYRAQLDVAKALAQAAKQAGAGTQQGIFDQLQGMAGLETIPVDVWVDADNLLRRFELSFSAAPEGATGDLKASLTMEMFDYGESIDVETPPASETVDARDIPGFTTG